MKDISLNPESKKVCCRVDSTSWHRLGKRGYKQNAAGKDLCRQHSLRNFTAWSNNIMALNFCDTLTNGACSYPGVVQEQLSVSRLRLQAGHPGSDVRPCTSCLVRQDGVDRRCRCQTGPGYGYVCHGRRGRSSWRILHIDRATASRVKDGRRGAGAAGD